ncbi:MAG: hypothetical protein IT350_02190 [Deltaproteobacteria bacterium]|nr:hypothetical protein [Deltaproteobacteria bacterium]
MRTSSTRFWLLFLLTAALFVSGCGCGDDDDDSGDDDDDDQSDDDTTDDDDVSDDDVDDDTGDDDTGAGCEEVPPSTNAHTLLGLNYLVVPAAPLAREEFHAALAEDPEDQDALMGLILADAVATFDAMSLIQTYIDYILQGYEEQAKAEDDNLQYYIDELLDELFGALFLDLSDEMPDLVDKASQVECLSLELTALPIRQDFEEIANVSGDDWDMSEVMASYGLVAPLSGAVRLLTVLNFNFDLSYVFGLADIDFGSYDTTEIISIIVDILDKILNDPAFPDFLTMADGGLEDYRKIQFELGLGFRAAADTFVTIRGETDDQVDDVLGYVDVNGDLAYEPDFDHYFVPGYGELDADGMSIAAAYENMFRDLGDSFLDNTEYDVDPANPNPFDFASLNALMRGAGLPPLLPSFDWALNEGFEGDITEDGLRNTLRTIVNLLQTLLPAPPPY